MFSVNGYWEGLEEAMPYLLPPYYNSGFLKFVKSVKSARDG